MKRIKVLFSVLLLLLALPLWRYMDVLTWIWASETLYSTALFFWGLLFLVLPVFLLGKRPLTLGALVLVIGVSLGSYFAGPLSGMATNDPTHVHCGRLTYTGMLYPLVGVTTQAHADDLEVRNQICWIKKMIQRVPKTFDDKDEYEAFMKLTQDKLMMPENKYRAALPMLALLHFVVLGNYEMNSGSKEMIHGKRFLEELKFWIDQYTVEISSRDYAWWDFPHSNYIQFEYGLIERNWEAIIDNLVIEESK